MKLYLWASKTEHGVMKTLGSNKQITITLDYEEPEHSWHCNDSSHHLNLFYYLDDKGKPTINICGTKAIAIIDKR